MKNKKIRKLNYNQAFIICHGKSEYHIAEYIKSNLRLPVKIFANQNGASSIQITALKTVFSRDDFQSIKKFGEKYNIEVIGSGKTATFADNFRIYIIMDTDDCTEEQKKNFINKQMFSKYPLGKYVYPVYNIRNLEDVLNKTEIMPERINAREKGDFYARVFPISGNKNQGTKLEIEDFQKQLEAIKPKPEKYTNMHEMIKELITLAKKKK